MGKDQHEEAKQGRKRGLARKGSQAADWATVTPALLVAAIEKAADTGGALRFGYSRDGGAYAIGIYGDGPVPYTEFVGPGDNLDSVLRDIGMLFDGIRDDQATEKGGKSLSRAP